MSNAARAKGKRGERACRDLFCDRDWEVHQRPRGEAGDDFTAIDPDGKVWSIEVKHTKSLNHSMMCQCKRNCPTNRGRILAWHPSGWQLPANLWVLFFWPKGSPGYVRQWMGKSPEKSG